MSNPALPQVKTGQQWQAANGTKFTVQGVVLDKFYGDYAVAVTGTYKDGRSLGDGCWFLQQTILENCQLVVADLPEWVIVSPSGITFTAYAAAADEALRSVIEHLSLSVTRINDEEWKVFQAPTCEAIAEVSDEQ